MEPENSSLCSKQPIIWPILSHVNHGQNLQHYFWKIIIIIVLYAPRFSKLLSSLRFPNQNAIYLSRLLVCATRFPLLILPHLIDTNNSCWGTLFMNIFIKQIFPASSHFLHVRSKYFPQHPILKYLQPLFVLQNRRPCFTPIIVFLSWKGHPNNMSKTAICWQKKRTEVQKSISSNCNSTFSLFFRI